MSRAVSASRLVMAAACAAMLVFGLFAVPRLVNPIWSDNHFTGWVAPVAHRMLSGAQIYQDFTLPVPPGSFALMAALQKALSRYRLIDELWLCLALQIGMCVVAFAMLRPFTSRLNAALASAATGPALIGCPKEVVYDHCAFLLAWGMLAALAHALTSQAPRRQAAAAALAGTLATFCFAFKTSTAAGACVALVLSLLLAWVLARRKGGSEQARNVLRSAGFAGAGAVAGAALCLLMVVALGAPVSGFLRAAFIDGATVTGTAERGPRILLSYFAVQAPAHFSLAMTVVAALVVLRLGKVKEALQLGGPPDGDEAADCGARPVLQNAWAVLALAGVFGLGVLALAVNAGPGPADALLLAGTIGGALLTMGLLALPAAMVANAAACEGVRDRRGAFAVLALGAGAVTVLQNLSHPVHLPLVHNNPILPLCALVVLAVSERAGRTRLRNAAFVLLLFTLFSDKFQGYLHARHPVQDRGFWAGLRVTEGGQHVLRAALRARELAGDQGTVFMLPEDPMVEALIDRPRPPLEAAIVFADQFPRRLLARDLRSLRDNPPEVVLVHPHDPRLLHVFTSAWSERPASSDLAETFSRESLDKDYRLDSTYPMRYFTVTTELRLFVRNRE